MGNKIIGDKKLLTFTVVFGALSVILGAFGAHALKPVLSEYSLGIYETASRYHFYHSLILLILCLVITLIPSYRNIVLKRSFYLFTLGIIFFSGSLYLLAVVQSPAIRSVLGPITPLGGLVLILAWLNLLFLLRRI